MPPGIHVKEKWRANVVIASGALCHRQDSFKSGVHFAVMLRPCQWDLNDTATLAEPCVFEKQIRTETAFCAALTCFGFALNFLL